MDEIWERAVETALDGQRDAASVRTLTLDGAVKCVQGRLPHPSLFQKFPQLQHLSIANIGVSSLEHFPRLQNLHKLILSDNRIAGGLEFLVQAGLDSLRDVDLSNNRIQDIDDLRPLADLRLVSLDLYECPVTRVKDYRSRVFGLIKSLKYLDKMDVDENERPESDEDEDEDDEDDDDEDEEDDPGSGEVEGEEKGPNRLTNGHVVGQDGVVDVDEDDESDADEEESEIVRGLSENNGTNGVAGQVNGFHGDGEEDDDDDSDEIDEEEGEDEEDVIEVHEVEDSDDEEDGVEDEEEDDDDDDGEEDDEDDGDDDDEEVDNDDGDGDGDVGEPGSSGWVTSTEGEIDGHEQGEDDVDEDDDGETGEEEVGVEVADFEDDEDPEDEEEEDVGTGYLVQPVAQVAEGAAGVEEDDPEVEEEEEEEEEDDVEVDVPASSSKRKRDEEDDEDEDADDAKSPKHN